MADINKENKGTKTIQELLAEIQQKLKAPKNQRNTFGNFNYRSSEDILEAVKPLLEGAILILGDEIVNIGNKNYVKATAMLAKGNEKIECSAYAREAEEKRGMDPAQVTGATSSYARKYALNGLFAIDDTKDADTMDNTVPRVNTVPVPGNEQIRRPVVGVATGNKSTENTNDLPF